MEPNQANSGLFQSFNLFDAWVNTVQTNRLRRFVSGKIATGSNKLQLVEQFYNQYPMELKRLNKSSFSMYQMCNRIN